METRTITIKSFEYKDGKTNGRPWQRLSIKATDGKFYSSFEPIAEAALAVGTQLELKVKQSKLPDTFDIEKVISFTPPASPQSTSVGPGGNTHPTPPPPPGISSIEDAIEGADAYSRELLDRAITQAYEKMPPYNGEDESMRVVATTYYPYLIATLVQTMAAKITSDRIAKQEAAKLKAYGNKTW